MNETRTWKRIRERLELKLPVRVRCRETADFEWTEVTRLTDVTPFGAGFSLKHPTEKGRLLHMTIPMPRQLRVFDYVEDQYRIWTVVRHVRAKKDAGDSTIFEVGVAFIGKRPPVSYEREPWRRYSLVTNASGALAVAEEEVKPAPSADQRQHTRHHIPIDMTLEVFDENGVVKASESTVCENISKSGATVFTTLQVPLGRFIRLTSSQYNLTVHAAVRARSTGADGIPRIHVEFIDTEWPL